MEQISHHNFKEERDILKNHGIEVNKNQPCINRTISVESNPVTYNVIQVNSKGVRDRYNEILKNAKGKVLVIGAGNMSFANDMFSRKEIDTITVIEEEEDIFDSILKLPGLSKIDIRKIKYSDFKESTKYDFIFIDTCKCLDTPKELIDELKGKFMQFLQTEGKLVSWFDGI